MGYDIYLRWDGITKEEQEAQYTGYSVVHGHVGYLRESYGGCCYATTILLEYENDNGEIEINSEILERRKQDIITACQKRYDGEQIKDRVIKSWMDFIELYKLKEEAGLKPIIMVC